MENKIKRAIRIEYGKNGDNSIFKHTLQDGKKWVKELGINQMLGTDHLAINDFLDEKKSIINTSSTTGKYTLYAIYIKVNNNEKLRGE